MVRDVMEVVVPLRGVRARHAALVAREAMRLVAVVLEHEVDLALAPGALAHAARKLGQEVGRGVVDDRVHGVEPQAVGMELFQPVERVVDEELAHRLARRRLRSRWPAPHGVLCRSVKNGGAIRCR